MPKRMRGLYKQKNSTVWWCCYKSLSGRVIRQSTKEVEYDKAVDFLMKRRGEVKSGKEPEFKKILNYTFNDLAKEYRPWCERQRGAVAKQRCINQLVERFGNCSLRQFSTLMLEQYQTERLLKGAKHKAIRKGPEGNKIAVVLEGTEKANKPATINRHIATIKHMFTKAVEWEMVEEDVLKRVRKVKMLPENNKRLRYLSKEECQQLIETCSGNLKAIVTTALNTGMRRGEIFSLTWDQVDLRHGFILLEETKNGERREIPINETLRHVLEELPRRIDGGKVFFNAATGNGYETISKPFARACRLAQIVGFRFHDLRHTFASQLVMAGIDLTTVKELLGHKTLAMTLRYAHLAPSHKVKALDVLNETLNGTSYLLHSVGVN
jgi:integrase